MSEATTLARTIPGFGRYKATTDGQIIGPRRLLRHRKSRYAYVSVMDDQGRKYTRLVHRLVALAFIPNPCGLPTVNHKDGNKLNNRVSNLEWASFSDQQQHALRLGLTARGTPRQLAVLREGAQIHYRKKRAMTHCKRGHPLFGPNLRHSAGHRHCRQCDADGYRRRKQ